PRPNPIQCPADRHLSLLMRDKTYWMLSTHSPWRRYSITRHWFSVHLRSAVYSSVFHYSAPTLCLESDSLHWLHPIHQFDFPTDHIRSVSAHCSRCWSDR